MARKKSGGDEGGGANWMDTYGDLVTLLLCFFVLLFSFSSMDSAKWQALVGAFSGSNAISLNIMTPEMAMEAPISDISPGLKTDQEVDDTEIPEEADPNFMELYENIDGFIKDNNLQEETELTGDWTAHKVTVRFKNKIQFRSGSDALETSSYETLNLVSRVIEENISLIHKVIVEGHTDNRDINTGRFPDNNILSAYRARQAMMYILNNNKSIPEDKMSMESFGPNRPVADNNTPEGQALNRRVDFVIESTRGVDN